MFGKEGTPGERISAMSRWCTCHKQCQNRKCCNEEYSTSSRGHPHCTAHLSAWGGEFLLGQFTAVNVEYIKFKGSASNSLRVYFYLNRELRMKGF